MASLSGGPCSPCPVGRPPAVRTPSASPRRRCPELEPSQGRVACSRCRAVVLRIGHAIGGPRWTGAIIRACCVAGKPARRHQPARPVPRCAGRIPHPPQVLGVRPGGSPARPDSVPCSGCIDLRKANRRRVTRRTAPRNPGNSTSPTIRKETPTAVETGGKSARYSLDT